MRIPFYGIYEINRGKLEVYHLIEGVYQRMTPDERGHYPIAPMQVKLGLWQGTYHNQPEQLWLRWGDWQGNLLLIGNELAQQEWQKRQRLIEHLRSLNPEQLAVLGIDPDMLN